MELNSFCKFEVIPLNPKKVILPGHLCSSCKYLLIIPFQCKSKEDKGCIKKFCPTCLKEEKECEECGEGKVIKNEKMEKTINEIYKVKCNLCFEVMLPNQFHQHLKEKACKIEISSNNNHQIQEKSKEEENEKDKVDIEKDLSPEEDVIVSCGFEFFGEKCDFKCKRSRMVYHQIDCKKVDNTQMLEYPLYSRLIYLLIGVGEYKDKMMKNLKAPPNDIKEIKYCLEKIGFEKNDENIILNQKACKSDIEELMKGLKEEMEGKNDNENEKKFNSHSMIFFYFSGHGIQDEKKENYQICPHDYQLKKRKNGIDLQFLVESLFKINCMHVLIVLDCCFGGGIFR